MKVSLVTEQGTRKALDNESDIVLQHPAGQVRVTLESAGTRTVSVEHIGDLPFCKRRTCRTAYSLDLIE